MGKYNYKIVVICPAATWFRNRNYEFALNRLNEITSASYTEKWSKIRNQKELDYSLQLLADVRKFNDSYYELRVESPRLNFYTNEKTYIETLANSYKENVKFICLPNSKLKKLEPGEVIVKKLDYDYKVFLASIRKKNYSNFIEWAKGNKKIRLTKRCIRDLQRDFSFGGSYFYVKDDKTLTMVKVFLGVDVSRIEQVIKA